MPNDTEQPLFVAALKRNRCPERRDLLVSQHKNRPPYELVDGVPVTTAGETLLVPHGTSACSTWSCWATPPFDSATDGD